MTYYSNQVDQSLGQVQLKITQKDYVGARSAVDKYIFVRRNTPANKEIPIIKRTMFLIPC